MLEAKTPLAAVQLSAGRNKLSSFVFSALRAGADDFAEGLQNWRIWHLMGTSELRRRYSRSTLGQFWLTLSTAVTVVTLGLVWSLLWNMSVAELLPYFAVSYICWTFLTAFLTEASGVFVGTSNYFINQRMSFSTVIYALTYRNLITLTHNSVIIIFVLVFFKIQISWHLIESIAGLIMATITGCAIAYLIGMVCLRYRDLVQLVTSVTQIIFFVTPVLWKESLLPPEKRWIVDYNPFAIFLALIRDPILGQSVSRDRWFAAFAIMLAMVALSFFVVGRLRRRIIFWI